jgi:hypothetical protein
MEGKYAKFHLARERANAGAPTILRQQIFDRRFEPRRIAIPITINFPRSLRDFSIVRSAPGMHGIVRAGQ